MVASVVTKFGWIPIKIVGEIENSSGIWSWLRKFQSAISFAILADHQTSDSLYDYDTLYKVWMNRRKIRRGAES